MPGATSFRKGLKICGVTTFIFLIISIVIFVTLYFTMFKPKQPQVTAHPVSLENIEIQIYPFSLNVTIGLIITINNRNYGSFKYKNSTAYIDYHGINIAEVPIESESVPARGKLDLSTYANVTADKLVTNSNFWNDLVAGSFNLTSTATLRGKVTALKIFKLKATVFSTCDISIFIQTRSLESNCYSKIKL